ARGGPAGTDRRRGGGGRGPVPRDEGGLAWPSAGRHRRARAVPRVGRRHGPLRRREARPSPARAPGRGGGRRLVRAPQPAPGRAGAGPRGGGGPGPPRGGGAALAPAGAPGGGGGRGGAELLEQLHDPSAIPSGPRDAYAALGAAQAFALDRLYPGWKARAIPG